MASKRVFWGMSILMVSAFLVAGYFAYWYFTSPEAVVRREVAKWVGIIGRGVDLPKGEIPTLATVTNKDRLDQQAFFQKAENGDKMLIYSQSGIVILYRPSLRKVIDMSRVVIEKAQPQ